MYGCEPRRAIIVCSRENNAHESLGVNVCGGFEKHIDRWSREVDELVNGERELRALIEQQVIIRWSKVYSPRLHAHLIFRLLYLQSALPRKNLRKQARSFTWQVQHN